MEATDKPRRLAVAAGRRKAKYRRESRRSSALAPDTFRSIGGNLIAIEGTLRLVYAAAVTAAFALRAQNSDYDGDVAGCLRVGVCEPLEIQLEELKAVIRRFAPRLSK